LNRAADLNKQKKPLRDGQFVSRAVDGERQAPASPVKHADELFVSHY
jgi:hypothetical protein